MSTRDPSKRIPKSLGTDTKLFGTYTLMDLAVALLPGVLVVLLLQVVVPSTMMLRGYRVQALTLPVAGVAIAVGGLFVYLTPSYASSIDWIETFVQFHTNSTEHNHQEAKEYTQVERVHTERGAIERTDGVFVGMVQVNPPTMALATDEEWRAKADAFSDFLNTTVEFPMQIYSTTQAFPIDDYLGQYTDRLNDPDIKVNSKLARLIDNYVAWYESELDARQMTIRDHYVIVTVAPNEVQFERESITQKLAALPLFGLLVGAWFGPHPAEVQEVMFETLDERLRAVETGLREIDGCAAQRIEVTEATRLVGEFWSGEDLGDADLQSMLRTDLLVRRNT